jgi:hypothetical protein
MTTFEIKNFYLYNIKSDCTTFMIIMSWSSTTDNRMVACDAFFAAKTESVLLNFNHSKYTANSFIGMYDQWKNHIIEYQNACK